MHPLDSSISAEKNVLKAMLLTLPVKSREIDLHICPQNRFREIHLSLFAHQVGYSQSLLR